MVSVVGEKFVFLGQAFCSIIIMLKMSRTFVVAILIFQVMLTQLRAIFDIIVEFQAKQSRMYTECLQEIELRQQYNATGEAHTEKVTIVAVKHMYFCIENLSNSKPQNPQYNVSL